MLYREMTYNNGHWEEKIMKISVRKCTAALCLMALCAALTACGPDGKAKETEESRTGRQKKTVKSG